MLKPKKVSWLNSSSLFPVFGFGLQPVLKKCAAALHEPPKPGLPLAKGYPLPMVDHHTERDRCLAIFAKHKEERS